MQANPGFRDVIVGNEPNLNRFWLPQFNEDGTGASAPAYNALLAATYDAVKAAAPENADLGRRACPPRSRQAGDGARHDLPTRFIREWGVAYAASGRTKPIMDGFAFHPYADQLERRGRPAADRPRPPRPCRPDKLVRLLGKAFDGTAQVGSGMPILYDEYGIESVVPQEKALQYIGTSP